jgi:hypothetical protein
MKRRLTNRETTEDPEYYTNKPIEPIAFILANQIPYCEGNVIKYLVRWKEKGGVEDLRKAKRYIDFLIENETNT